MIYIKKNFISKVIKVITQLIEQNINSSVIDFITIISNTNNMQLIDIKGEWAELDSLQDIKQFQFGTKAETLFSLKNKLNKSIVLDQFTFNVEEYKTNYKNA